MMVYRTAEQIEKERKRAVTWAKKTRGSHNISDEGMCNLMMCSKTVIESIEHGANSTLSPVYVASVINQVDNSGYSLDIPKYVSNYISTEESQKRIKWFRSEPYKLRVKRRSLSINIERAAAAIGMRSSELRRYELGEYMQGTDSIARRYRDYLERKEHHK